MKEEIYLPKDPLFLKGKLHSQPIGDRPDKVEKKKYLNYYLL
jgi:hypothetical protein